MRVNRRERVRLEKKKNKWIIAIETVLTVFMAIFLLTVVIQRVSNNRISIGGIRVFTVLSESMKPVYNVWDIVITKDVQAKDLKIGDDITYKGLTGDVKGKIITHRIENISYDETTHEYKFVTRGIANVAQDDELSENQILGKVVYKTFLLSLFSKASRTTWVFILFVFIPLAIYITIEMVNIVLEKNDTRRYR
jgi:signal peptidase